MAESRMALFDKFKNYWSVKILPIVEAHIPAGHQPKILAEMLINHIISTIIELMKFWLQDGLRYTPEQMEQYFFELVYPVLSKQSELKCRTILT